MYLKLTFWILILLGTALEIVGDVFFKKWALEHRPTLLAIGLLIYAIGSLFWALSLRYEILSKAIAVFTILNLVIVACVGVIFFQEQISTMSKIGIFLGLVSIALIELG